MSTLLQQTKVALRLKTTDAGIEDEIVSLINAAIADLKETAGVDVADFAASTEIGTDGREALLALAVKTYVRLHFGAPDDYDRLAASYDMQKKQLLTRYYAED